jgi:hypothetical protein
MAIHPDVMAHMHDNPHTSSAPVCLQHLLDLWAHAITAYAIERHPDTAKVGANWAPQPEEVAELNALLVEVRDEHLKTHSHVWFKQVDYTMDTTGSGTVSVPDEHQYVMDYLIAIRESNPDISGSSIPSRVTEQ